MKENPERSCPRCGCKFPIWDISFKKNMIIFANLTSWSSLLFGWPRGMGHLNCLEKNALCPKCGRSFGPSSCKVKYKDYSPEKMEPVFKPKGCAFITWVIILGAILLLLQASLVIRHIGKINSSQVKPLERMEKW